MAEENGAAPPVAAAEGATANPPSFKVLAQYVRDMSFENIAVQKQVTAQGQPDIQVKVGMDARKRSDTQYEVMVKLNVESKTKEDEAKTIFILELDYAGVFHIDNVPEAQLHPFLMIECPRMLFPFIRRIVSDVTRDGGFPPLNLETIDFVSIYRNELARRAAQQKTADA